MITKRIPLTLKADNDAGTVEAVFATLGVVDLDGDRIMPGAVGNQEVVMSAYGHRSWDGALPLGKGKVFERGDKAIFEGQFFMDTAHGADAFRTVKGVGDLQEWSFALLNADYNVVNEDGKDIQEVTKIDIPEVSPVLRGAGIGTRTVDIKGLPESEERENLYALDIKPQPFVTHAEEAIKIADEVVTRAVIIRALGNRNRNGKERLLGADARERLKTLRDRLVEIQAEIDEQLQAKTPADEVREIAERFEVTQYAS